MKRVHEDITGRCLVARSQDKDYFNRDRMKSFAHNIISMQLKIAN